MVCIECVVWGWAGEVFKGDGQVQGVDVQVMEVGDVLCFKMVGFWKSIERDELVGFELIVEVYVLLKVGCLLLGCC